MAPASGQAQTANAVQAAAEKRTREGTVLVQCTVCGAMVCKWKSNMAKAKWPPTCGRKCRGELMRGPVNPHWKGGSHVETRTGYRLLRTDMLTTADKVLLPSPTPRYVPEHRMVTARLLGRWPTRREHVHHINGNKLDNRPENLTLMDWAAHSREHRQVLKRLVSLEVENRILRAALAERQPVGGLRT